MPQGNNQTLYALDSMIKNAKGDIILWEEYTKEQKEQIGMGFKQKIEQGMSHYYTCHLEQWMKLCNK